MLVFLFRAVGHHFFAQNLNLEHIIRLMIYKRVKGHVLGPFPEPTFPNLRVSHLGIVPKKASRVFQLIHHLSYPRGGSVNDGIPKQLCFVHYTSFDQAMMVVRNCRVGADLAKWDFSFLGFSFQGQFCIDRALLISCSISHTVFSATAWAFGGAHQA